MSTCSIKVVTRFRPLQNDETLCEPSRLSVLSADTVRYGQQSVKFDTVFGEQTTQLDIFQSIGLPAVVDVLEGYNTTIFAYGQTGSGKTFTMHGRPSAPPTSADAGLTARIMAQLFAAIDATDAKTEFILKCSYLEIYNEVCLWLVASLPRLIDVIASKRPSGPNST